MNIQRLLASRLQSLTYTHRLQQRTYIERLGKSMEGMDPGSEEDLDDTMVLDDDLTEWDRERSRGVEELLGSLRDLGELFKDLSSLVLEQGTLLDRIDYNIQLSVAHTQSAAKELRTVTSTQAEKRQRCTRSLSCIFALVLLIVVLVLALVLKHI